MFIALLKQSGEGCDYSIACGRKWVELEATTLPQALDEVHALIFGTAEEDYEDGSYNSYEFSLSEATILEVSNLHVVPVKVWYDEQADYKEQMKAFAKLEDERQEYMRLSKKFGNADKVNQ